MPFLGARVKWYEELSGAVECGVDLTGFGVDSRVFRCLAFLVRSFHMLTSIVTDGEELKKEWQWPAVIPLARKSPQFKHRLWSIFDALVSQV